MHYSYHIGMCERAAELGHSLLFPAICRYCHERIYLFATPEGGFAIFDDIGGDWPKHECWGVDQSTTRYSEIAPTYSRTFTFPVPEATPVIVAAAPGARLVGTIVSQSGEPRMGFWQSSLYDGKSLYTLGTEQGGLLGRCVRGAIQLRAGIPILSFLEILSPPGVRLTQLGVSRERATPTEVKSVQSSAIWSLQEQAHMLEKTHPTTAATLSMALEALLNGYTLAGMLLLTRILSRHAEQVATKVKATALRVILLAIRDLKLPAVVPAIVSRLSGGTLSAMDEDTHRLLTELSSLGELHRHFVPPQRIRQSFERRLTKERRYLEKTQPDSDVAQDFAMLWQS